MSHAIIRINKMKEIAEEVREKIPPRVVFPPTPPKFQAKQNITDYPQSNDISHYNSLFHLLS